MNPEAPDESVGARLRRLRQERGLSQRDVASPGVSYSYVSRIEAGQRLPSVRAIRALAAKLRVSPEYLETGHELPGASEWELKLGEAELTLRLDDAAAAEKRFGELLLEAEAAEDDLNADRARVGLAFAAARQHRHHDAVSILEDLLARQRPPVGERPDLYAVLGRAYAAVGETPRAVALFSRCLEEIAASKVPEPVLFIRFASYLSYALMDIGDALGAHQALVDALERAEGIRDRTTLIRLYWSLGRYYWMEGPPARALDYFRRAIALLEATEDTFYLARAHEACATILLDQASAEPALEHLEIAEQLFRGPSESAYVGSVRAERARFALQLGNPEEARSYAVEALRLLAEAEPVEVGRTWRTLADVFERLGDLGLAERAYRTAVQKLIEQAAVRELAETYRAWGKFLRARGREGEALDAFERAADLAGHVAPVARVDAAERSRARD